MQIFLTDIEFISAGEEELKLQERKRIYPPRFNVVITCSPNAKHNIDRIQFNGATSELVYDIPLNPQHSPSTAAAATTQPSKQTNTLRRYNDLNSLHAGPCDYASSEFPLTVQVFLNNVGAKIQYKWRLFGIALEIPQYELNTYPADKPLECFAQLFDSWERNGNPELSWKTVIGILDSPMLREKKLAATVKRMVSSHIPPKPKPRSNTDPTQEYINVVPHNKLDQWRNHED